jgi:hypothetical protein
VRPPSIQLQSILDAFGKQGWQAEQVEGREVVQTAFESHHTSLHLHAQVFPELNALAIVAETPFALPTTHKGTACELLLRANKQLTLGGFEYDFDRGQLVFRLTNIFERERFDADIISSLVHCAIAELDRMVPLVSTLNRTAPALLADLSLPLLLEREDLLPPVPEFDEEEEL